MKIYNYFGFLFAIAALATGIAGINLLSKKPALPFEYIESNNFIIAAETYQDTISEGDILEELNGYTLNNTNKIEFLCDALNIGDEVTIKIQRIGIVFTTTVVLEKAYKDNVFLYISSITGLAFWLLGVFVFIKKPSDKIAGILFIMLMFFSSAIMTSPGKYNNILYSYSTLIRILHLFAYAGGISFLLHFSLVFPQRLYAGNFIISLAHIFMFGFGVVINIVQIKIITSGDIFYIDIYYTIWKILLLILLTSVIWVFINFGISFVSPKDVGNKRRVQWVLWGLLTGVLPYVVFWVIPNLLGFKIPINEEYSIAFFIFIPISFVIGVLRYKVFDIEYIFSKSIIYGTITIIITAIFFSTIYILSIFFSSIIGEILPIYSLISAVFIALIFNPLRIKVQVLVDKYFYRVKYDFRKVISKMNLTFSDCNSAKELGTKLLEEIDYVIPTTKSAIFLNTKSGETKRLLAHLNRRDNHSDKYVMSIPLKINQDSEFGTIMLGEKLSGIKYLDSDLEILNMFADNAASLIHRIELRIKVLESEIENKRLEELNAMKSDFVSSVSHELKTPLTSIHMFAETLMSDRDIDKEKQKEYAEIIYGESGRLSRTINRLLDFTKIERGIKKYYLEEICINNIINYVLHTMEYQFKKKKAKLIRNLCKDRVFIMADRDAMAEVLINLLSNALKYSQDCPIIEVNLTKDNGNAIISIKDNGRGIAEEETEKIFENFYRIENENEKHIGGAGIGLAIVKSIIVAHEAEIKVKSKIGEGSTFILKFKTLKN